MWLDPNSAVLMTGMDGVVISEVVDGERGITSTLDITRTAPSLGGEYRCLADNGVAGRGDINTASAILTVFGERSYRLHYFFGEVVNIFLQYLLR